MIERTFKALELTSSTLWLAPLAGYTDQAFRQICKEWGADVMVSEMVSADGLVQNQKKTQALLNFEPWERPFGIQLFGSEPDIMAKAAVIAAEYNPDFIDLNMGCPVRKVIKRHAGGALMIDIERAIRIVEKVRTALPDHIPLSVKFRSGWDNEHLNYLNFGLALEKAGADILVLHPRTVKQAFHGNSNWDHIKILKEHTFIPLVGNGDIKNREDAFRMKEQTKCDAVMIGRGALGNPWLFALIKRHSKHKTDFVINNKLKLLTIQTHIKYALQYKPERLVQRELKSQLCFYIKGLKYSASIRDKINHAESVNAIKQIINEAFQNKYTEV